MKTIRVAHISDTHLGYRAYSDLDPRYRRNQRTLDFEIAFADAITKIISLNPDLIIHSGDVFHYPSPDWRTVGFFIEQMQRVERSKISTIIIGGNHDTPRLRSAGSVFTVTEAALPGIRHVCGYDAITQYFVRLDVTVQCIPYGYLHTNREIPTPSHRAGINLAAIHGGLISNLTPELFKHGEGEVNYESFDTSPYDYVALGHHHLHYRGADRSWYAGSTERCGFSDEKSLPGFLLVEIEGGSDLLPLITHYQVEHRTMLTLNAIDASGTKTASQLADDIIARVIDNDVPNGIVRIELIDPERRLVNQVQRLVSHRRHDSAWKILVFTRTDFKLGERDSEQYGSEKLGSLVELFEEFLNERQTNYPPGFLERFREKGNTVLKLALETSEQEA